MHPMPMRSFRLAPGKIACDGGGLRIGDVALLRRNARGFWTVGEAADLNEALAACYGLSAEIEAKRQGLATVASALNAGDLARAQIATLFLHLTEPPEPSALDEAEARRLVFDLAGCGLLKADADWDAKHPRAGTAPNAG